MYPEPDRLNPYPFNDGDVLGVHTMPSLWRPNTWISKRIQSTTYPSDFEGIRLNHVALLARDDAGELYGDQPRWWVYEALFNGGVVCRPLKTYLNPKRYRLQVYRHPDLYGGPLLAPGAVSQRQDAVSRKIVKYADDQLGEPYNTRKILTIRGLQLLGHTPTSFSSTTWAQDSHICSGLVAKAYRYQAMAPDSWGPFVDPGHLVKDLDLVWQWNAPQLGGDCVRIGNAWAQVSFA